MDRPCNIRLKRILSIEKVVPNSLRIEEDKVEKIEIRIDERLEKLIEQARRIRSLLNR